MMQTKISTFSRPSFALHETRVVHQPRISMALPSSPSPFKQLLCKSTFPLAASLTLLLSPCTAQAGLMSGSPGIESVPGPELPKLEFLERFNAKNQKFYAENDSRFKESPILKKLLENSKLNCTYSSQVWVFFISRLNLAPPQSFEDILRWLIVPSRDINVSLIVRLIFQAVVYMVWKERNRRVLLAVERSPSSIIAEVKQIIRLRLDPVARRQVVVPGQLSVLAVWLSLFTS